VGAAAIECVYLGVLPLNTSMLVCRTQPCAHWSDGLFYTWPFVESFLSSHTTAVRRPLPPSMDVVTPTYRVDMDLLKVGPSMLYYTVLHSEDTQRGRPRAHRHAALRWALGPPPSRHAC
jgi:hypothetical protein